MDMDPPVCEYSFYAKLPKSNLFPNIFVMYQYDKNEPSVLSQLHWHFQVTPQSAFVHVCLQKSLATSIVTIILEFDLLIMMATELISIFLLTALASVALEHLLLLMLYLDRSRKSVRCCLLFDTCLWAILSHFAFCVLLIIALWSGY